MDFKLFFFSIKRNTIVFLYSFSQEISVDSFIQWYTTGCVSVGAYCPFLFSMKTMDGVGAFSCLSLYLGAQCVFLLHFVILILCQPVADKEGLYQTSKSAIEKACQTKFEVYHEKSSIQPTPMDKALITRMIFAAQKD